MNDETTWRYELAASVKEPVMQQVAFRGMAKLYCARWPVLLQACKVTGEVVMRSGVRGMVRNVGRDIGRCVGRVGKRGVKGEKQMREARELAIAEAMRWGEPTFQLCAGSEDGAGGTGRLLWAMPVMCNAKLLGGIVAEAGESEAFSGRWDVRQATRELREMVEERNLTNGALLAANRAKSQSEQHRAEAIHEWKSEQRYDFHRMYQLEEPALLGAIRRGDRREARAVVNRLLTGMIHAAGQRLDLAKSFFLELVVTMTRTAVEAGGEPQELLGANFTSLTELAKIESDEDLAGWLHAALESVLAGLHVHRESTDRVLMGDALQFMQRHLGEDVSRDDAAEVACMSRSHFSRVFHKHFGRSFSDLLNQMRVDKAAELLSRSQRSTAVIALECGFSDQSYFTKVFRKYRGITPAEYRRNHLTDGV